MGENTQNTTSRFASVSREDVDDLIAKEENENTKKNTTYDVNIVLKFLAEERSESRDLENIPPLELNSGILASIDRYLTRKEYGKRLFIDQEFARLREALKAKQKKLKKQGRRNKPNATTALTDKEIDIIQYKKVLVVIKKHLGHEGCFNQTKLRKDIVQHKGASIDHSGSFESVQKRCMKIPRDAVALEELNILDKGERMFLI
ncbi:hypothetical protein AC249_AIPGENE22734 [Exaiptasia diaphana]|nr:hypothetical protein AC249_AIPGENE22734 [Exaiptasia diaphana]